MKKPNQPDVPHARFWIAKFKNRSIVIECERWYDARDIARRYFGSLPTIVPSNQPRYPRLQVRWAGTAAGASTLRKQVRRLRNQQSRTQWKDLWDFP